MAEEGQPDRGVELVQEGAACQAEDVAAPRGEHPDAWNLISAGPSLERLKPEHLIEGAPTVTVNRAISVIERGIKVHFAAFADGPSGYWTPLGLERYLRMEPSLQLWVTLRPVTQKVTIYRKARWKPNMEPPHFMKDFLKNCMKILPWPVDKAFTAMVEKYFLQKEERFQIDAPGPPLAYLWDKELPAITGIRVLPHGPLIDVHDKKTTREAFTTYCALDRIWMFKPKLVRILCCDMVGSWIPGKSEEECAALEQEKVTAGKTPAALDRWAHERHHLLEAARLAKEKIGADVEWVSPA